MRSTNPNILEFIMLGFAALTTNLLRYRYATTERLSVETLPATSVVKQSQVDQDSRDKSLYDFRGCPAIDG